MIWDTENAHVKHEVFTTHAVYVIYIAYPVRQPAPTVTTYLSHLGMSALSFEANSPCSPTTSHFFHTVSPYTTCSAILSHDLQSHHRSYQDAGVTKKKKKKGEMDRIYNIRSMKAIVQIVGFCSFSYFCQIPLPQEDALRLCCPPPALYPCPFSAADQLPAI